MGFFGPSRGEVWAQLSDSIGASFTQGSIFTTDRVDANVDGWIVTLDSFAQSDGKYSTRYTRIRAPFRNNSGLRFSVRRSDIFTGLGKLFGFQDITTGDARFDEDFVISGNDVPTVMSLFSDPRIKQLLEYQPNVNFDVRDSEGWFGPKFPADTDELYFLALGIVTDIGQLQSLFELFSEVLHKLTELGATSPGDAGVFL